jgi:hypothetical protein
MPPEYDVLEEVDGSRLEMEDVGSSAVVSVVYGSEIEEVDGDMVLRLPDCVERVVAVVVSLVIG